MSEKSREYGTGWIAIGTVVGLMTLSWFVGRDAGAQPKTESDGRETQITAGRDISAAELADFLGIERFSFGFENAGGWRLVYDHWEKGKLAHASRNLLALSDAGEDAVQIIYQLDNGKTNLRFLTSATGGSTETTIPLGAAGKGNSGTSTYGRTSAGEEKRIALGAIFFDVGGLGIEASRNKAVETAKKCGAAIVFYAERGENGEAK